MWKTRKDTKIYVLDLVHLEYLDRYNEICWFYQSGIGLRLDDIGNSRKTDPILPEKHDLIF